MSVPTFTKSGTKATTAAKLDATIFDIEVSSHGLVKQAYVSYQANGRENLAKTLRRGEVRGGGKKPWQQKGTGRARHGSIRSPIWRGGGITFGPLSIRNYKTKINKKIKKLATKMCLADRAQNESFLVVEDFNFSEPKTKLFVKFIAALPKKFKSFLVLTPGKNDILIRMTRNLKSIQTTRIEDVNVMDLLSNTAVIINKSGVEKLETAFSKI